MNLRRGDVVVVVDGSGAFTGKPRPAVVVQADAFADRTMLTICPITSQETTSPLFRLAVSSPEQLNLTGPSWIAVDLITTVRRNRVSATPIGHLLSEDITKLSASMAVYFGIG